MICPRCEKSLLYRERPNQRCSACGRAFALEPKTSPLRLHDRRIQRLASKLADHRNVRYTTVQLWYLAVRRDIPDVNRTYNRIRAGLPALVVAGGFLGIVTGTWPALPTISTVAILLIVILVATRLAKPTIVAHSKVRIPLPYEKFSAPLAYWRTVYGGPPPGSVEPDYPLPTASQPRLALLCPDRSVLACLAANDAVRIWELALCQRPEDLPPQVPVLILHDAGLPGVGYAAHARQLLGSRAVLLGLSAKAVLGAPGAIRLHEPIVNRAPIPSWAAGSDTERDWLSAGWWSPIAAVPPAKLLRLVERGVERVREADDPDRRRAREIGFLTWPAR